MTPPRAPSSSAGLRAALAAACALFLFLFPASALGAQYEIELDIETEDDLYDLEQQGQISAATLETLVDLLQSGVDLATASREELYSLPNLTYTQVDAILEYRQLSGGIDDPADLVASGALTAEELKQIAPFLVLGAQQGRLPLAGWVKAESAVASADRVLPPAYLKLRLSGYDLRAGVALLSTRQRLGPVSYDAERDALTAPAPVPGLEVPKFYVRWSSSQRMLLAGTFSAGFAERLTLDNSTRDTPLGFYADDTVDRVAELSSVCRQGDGAEELGASPCDVADTRGLRMTPDYRWRDRFRGVAGSVEDLHLGGQARASFFAFGSYATRSIYQYQLYDYGRCEDPHDPEDAACKPPPVFTQQPNPADPTSTYQYVTLPALVNEALGGAHAQVSLDGLTRFGVTGYYASPRWAVPGMRLDFQEWSPYPYHGDFGAFGVDGATRLGPVNVFAEATRSFDSMNGGGGGFAVLQRNAIALQKYQELELSFRYYDRNFANPYSRALAADDRLDGNRARNEAGARLEWTGRKMGDLSARAAADFWLWPEDGKVPNSAGRSNLELSGRVDYEGWRFLKLAGWAAHVNRDLKRNGLGNCYTDYSGGEDPEVHELLDDAVGLCSGERYDLGGRVLTTPFGTRWDASLTYRQVWATFLRSSAPVYGTAQAVTAEVRFRATDTLRLRARGRLFDESDRSLMSEDNSLWGTLEVRWAPGRQLTALLRYDAIAFTRPPARPSDPVRRPNPEHRLRLQVESRF